MSQKVMYDAAKIVLTRFLAPESADQAAAQVAAAYSACEQALQGLVPAPVERPLASAPPAEERNLWAGPEKAAKKTAARRRRTASVVAAVAQATAAPSTTPTRKSRTSKARSAASADNGVSASTTMRFKKKLYWATKRANDGAAPLAGDREVIQAAKEGKIIAVDQWTRQGRTPRAVQVPESGLGTKKAAAAKRPAKSRATKKAAAKKVQNTGVRVKAGRGKKAAAAAAAAAAAPAVGESIVLPSASAHAAPLNGGSHLTAVAPVSSIAADAPI